MRGKSIEVDYQKYEDLANKMFPGLTMYVRDVNLRETIASKYKQAMITQEKGLTDTSFRVMGMITTHRYSILSNHMRDLRIDEHTIKWGLCIATADSHFKVLDIHKYGNKTQILLLHLPEDDDWKLFQNAVFNLEGGFIQSSRERFENKCNLDPVPALATEEWLARCAFPLGIDDDGNLFELE